MHRASNSARSKRALACTACRHLAIAARGRLPTATAAPRPSANTSRQPTSPGSSSAFDAAVAVLAVERDRVRADRSSIKARLAAATAASVTSSSASSSTSSSDSSVTTDELARLRRSLHERTLDLGYSDLAIHDTFLNHRRQNAPSAAAASSADPDTAEIAAATLADMHRRRFSSYVLPRLLRASARADLFSDVFPGVIPEAARPSANLLVHFGGPTVAWEGTYGHAVPPNWTLHVPSVVVAPTTKSSPPARYSLVMTDIDRPNPRTRAVEEWCHWLVTNIPIDFGDPASGLKKFEVPGGLPPAFLRPPPAAEQADRRSMTVSYHPEYPASASPTESTWRSMGADEIFPYVPLHPANQEPRREHRYIIALFKQPSDRIDVDAQRLRERALERIKAAEDRLQSPALFVEDKGDELINTLARSSVSVWGFAKEHNLQLAGYAFVKSSWNVYTPEIFTRLGLHEPVYGRLNPKWSAGATMFRITGATEVAKSLEPGAVPTPATVAALNAGGLKTPTGARTAFRRGGSRAPAAPDAFQLPTRLAQEAEAMRQAAAESRQRAAAKDAARAGKKSKGVAARPPSPVQLLSKLPRVTALGSAGIVRAKETDPARRFVGPLSRRTVDRRGRFQNV